MCVLLWRSAEGFVGRDFLQLGFYIMRWQFNCINICLKINKRLLLYWLASLCLIFVESLVRFPLEAHWHWERHECTVVKERSRVCHSGLSATWLTTSWGGHSIALKTVWKSAWAFCFRRHNLDRKEPSFRTFPQQCKGELTFCTDLFPFGHTFYPLPFLSDYFSHFVGWDRRDIPLSYRR